MGRRGGEYMNGKRVLVYFLAVCMSLVLAACGGKDGGSAAVSSKEYVYKAEEVSAEGMENFNQFQNFSIKGERMYIAAMEWLEEGSRATFMNCKMDGSDVRSFTMDMSQNSYLSYINLDEQGNYYIIYDEFVEQNSEEEDSVYEDIYYLIKVDSTGKEVWKLSLNESGQDYWVKWMHLFPDGRIGVADQNGVSFYDTEGKPAGHLDPKEELDGGTYFLKDGTVVISVYNEALSKNVLRKLDINTGEYSEEYEISGLNGYSLYPGADSDFLLVGNGGIYSYNLGDAQVKKLLDFIDSDMSSSYVYHLSAVSEKEFYGVMADDMTGEEALMKFTKVDPKDVADKTVLTLACYYLDWEVRKYVVEFNKSNPDYRITITDYSQYDTDEDYTAGITKLNTDIVSGKMPDILLLNDNIPVESYAAKGLFEDLYFYIDQDTELKREDYFQNVLKVHENNGELYCLPSRFIIYTVTGKTADVGNGTGWTLQELKDVLAAKPEGTQVFSGMTRQEMLYYSIRMSGNQFIDWESGKCNFNTEGFISLLEFIKDFPEELPEDYWEKDMGMGWDEQLRQGKVLLDQTVLDSFSGYNYLKKAFFGEDITMIGFPSENKKGSAIGANIKLSMSSKSKNKDGAWQFLRYFLTEEYQEKDNYGWPLSLKQAELMAQKAQKKPTYEDENGNQVEYDETYNINGVDIVIEPMTQEEVEEVLGFMQSVDQLYTNNQALIDIISEEAAPYFAGQKNVKEVVDIIQNRVQIYVSENR